MRAYLWPGRFRRANILPPMGSQINWGHQLAQKKLICAILCNKNNGNEIIDYVSHAILSTYGTTVNGPYGLDTTVANSGIIATAPQSVKVTWPISLIWQGITTASPASSAYIAGCSYTTSNSAPYSAWSIYFGSSSEIQEISNSSGTYSLSSNSVSLPTGQQQIGAVIGKYNQYPNAANHNIIIYYGGKNTYSSTDNNLNGVITYSSTAQLFLGAPYSGSPNSGVINQFLYAWNDFLTDDEFAWLAAEPYCFWRPDYAIEYFHLSSVGNLITTDMSAETNFPTLTGNLDG
jgi:hypothetical protein